MSKKINRRDTLKVIGASVFPALFPQQTSAISGWLQPAQKRPNVLIIVLDTLSANHLSLYGYARPTSASMERFASRSTVYHSHFSGGNFTTAGTASMLTGLYPWSHRALHVRGLMKRSRTSENLFHQVGTKYHKMVFTQNLLAELLLNQFQDDINDHLPFTLSMLSPKDVLLARGFENDPNLSFYAYGDFLTIRQNNDGPLAGSSILGLLDVWKRAEVQPILEDYPLGAPTNSYYNYSNTATFGQILKEVERASAQDDPFLGYFHLWTPHEPYLPRKQFSGIYKEDGYSPVKKPEHILNDTRRPQKNLERLCRTYDEYVTDIDNDLGVFLDALDNNGILDNTYVVITSDHGQLFERGQHGHVTTLLFDSLIRIPLLISAPGQTQRKDVFVPTSNIDLLPTLTALSGQQVNPQTEGKLLPGFGGMEDWDRSVYSMVARTNSAFAPLKTATISLIKGTKKLIYYKGYENYDGVSELYDLADDREELKDLAADDVKTAANMRDELLTALEESDQANKAA
jgi:arylsulfatase A-like enzyme